MTEPLARVEPLAIAGRGDDHWCAAGGRRRIRPARRAGTGRTRHPRTCHPAGGGPIARRIPRGSGRTGCPGSGVGMPGRTGPGDTRNGGPPGFGIGIPDHVRIDQLARPVENHDDRVNWSCSECREVVADTQPLAGGLIGVVGAPVDKDDHGPNRCQPGKLEGSRRVRLFRASSREAFGDGQGSIPMTTPPWKRQGPDDGRGIGGRYPAGE